MASYLIHMCVAKELNKKIKKEESKLLIGSIAPDISKLINQNRDISHFFVNNKYDIDLFLSKYEKYLNDDFVLGYFIHLYTDYLWEKYFISKICNNGVLTLLDGTKEKWDENTLDKYIYNDYTSMNDELVKYYDIDLNIFNETFKIENIIKEIPINKINILIDKANDIISNAKKVKPYVIDTNSIYEFINFCTNKIYFKIQKIK